MNARLEHSAKTICRVNSLHFNPNRIDSFVGMRKMSRLTGGLGRSTIKRQHDAIMAEGLAFILQTKSGNRFELEPIHSVDRQGSGDPRHVR